MSNTEVAQEVRPVHVGGGEGEAVWAMSSLFEMKLDGAASAGALAVMEVTQPPGVATPLHVHHREAEAFFVLDGAMLYEAGGMLQRLERGSFMYLPKGVPHRFRVIGSSPVRFLGLVVPAGLEELYRSVGSEAAERRLPEPTPDEVAAEIARWASIASDFGLKVLGPPLPPEES